MAHKAKGMPRRWLTARNLLLTHVAFHVVFVFGYWFSVAASLSFSDLNFFENHLLALLSNASSNHLALLLLLAIHTLLVVANGWWKQRRQDSENRQIDSELGHLTAEEKLELLLDEVVELREGLHRRDALLEDAEREAVPARLHEERPAKLDELIVMGEFDKEQHVKQT